MPVITPPFIPIPPQVTVYLVGSGNYVVPSVGGKLPLYLEIELQGGGSGGSGSGTGTTGGSSLNAGNTTFDVFAAFGGLATSRYISGGGGAGGGPIIFGITGGSGQYAKNTAVASAVGGEGGQSRNGCAGQASPGLGLPPIGSSPNSGSGGGGAGTSATAAVPGGGGGAGGWIVAQINNPVGPYAYSVGAKSVGGTAGTSGFVGADGANGYVKVTARWQ